MSTGSAPKRPEYALIVALAAGNAIGRSGDLLFSVPEDMHHFKSTTMDHVVIMGRKTYDSLGKPLPGRVNIVLTHQQELPLPASVIVAHTFDEALSMAPEKKRIFVIGGAELYKETIQGASEIIATRIDAVPNPPADAFFPTISPFYWQMVECTPWTLSKRALIPYRIERYEPCN